MAARLSPARQMLLPPKPMLRDNSKETRQRTLSLSLLEEKIREHEAAIQRLSSELQRTGSGQNFERAHKLGWQIAQAQAALDQLMGEWEKLAI